MNILSSLQVKTEAARLGFSACGLAPAAPLPKERAEALHRWLAAGMHGEMSYLERHATLRLDPTLLVPGARTVVSVALNYYPAATPPEGGFRLARYALGLDYHDVVRQRLRALLVAIGAENDGRPCCDTAPSTNTIGPSVAALAGKAATDSSSSREQAAISFWANSSSRAPPTTTTSPLSHAAARAAVASRHAPEVPSTATARWTHGDACRTSPSNNAAPCPPGRAG